VFSYKLGNVGITLGLVGEGIPLALQEVITSLSGWISIILTEQIKVVQRVKRENVVGYINTIDFFLK
jgi:hypothetical protein